MIASQLVTVLSGLKDSERDGGKKIVLQGMESIRMELQFALRSSGQHEFQRAIDALNLAISLVEAGDCDGSIRQIGSAITAATTVAQHAWQELEKHEFV
jgi:ABC-type tungstate transport system substrate-binding protein